MFHVLSGTVKLRLDSKAALDKWYLIKVPSAKTFWLLGYTSSRSSVQETKETDQMWNFMVILHLFRSTSMVNLHLHHRLENRPRNWHWRSFSHKLTVIQSTSETASNPRRTEPQGSIHTPGEGKRNYDLGKTHKKNWTAPSRLISRTLKTYWSQ